MTWIQYFCAELRKHEILYVAPMPFTHWFAVARVWYVLLGSVTVNT